MFISCGVRPCAEKSKKQKPVATNKQSHVAAGFAQQLPNFSLADPSGKWHTRKSILKNGIVLVVSAPVASQSEEQQGWAKILKNSRPKTKAHLVFLEDMQSSGFKEIARSKMKERFLPGRDPIVLIDENGRLRRALKVPKEHTVVLVYDRKGKLIYTETGKPRARRGYEIWKKLKRT